MGLLWTSNLPLLPSAGAVTAEAVGDAWADWLEGDAERPAAVVDALGLVSIPELPTTSRALALFADDVSGDDGDPVSSWTDGTHTGAASGSARPTLVRRAIGGRAALRFDGSDDLIAVPHAAALSPSTLTLYVVGRARRNSSGDVLYNRWLATRPVDGSNSSPYSDYGVYVTGESTVEWRADGATGSGTLVQIPTWDQPAVWCLSIGAGGSSLHINGRRHSTNATTSVTYGSDQPLWIGGRSGGEYFFGDIAAVVLFGARHTAAERGAVEAHLAARYSLTVVSSDTA